jgi:hypothetical protein
VGIETKRRSVDRVESNPLSILASSFEFSSFCVEILMKIGEVDRLASKLGRKERGRAEDGCR